MYESSKYSNFLTILLVIIIIAIVGLIGYFTYSVYTRFTSEQDANEFVNNFSQDIRPSDTNQSDDGETDNSDSSLSDVESIQGQGSSSGKKPLYKNKFEVVGTIEIPKTKLAYPILADASKSSLENAVGMLCGPGPNKQGNTVILGHNYRNGQFFANNKKLSIGDKIYITDLSGKKLSYTVYNKFEVESNDTDFIVRNTNGAREISLQTCTDDGNLRLIIVAKCDNDN